MPALFCGIDIGTQGARCVMVRDDGRLLSEADCSFRKESPPPAEGWLEQEPGSWLEAASRAVRKAVGMLDGREPGPDRPVAIGVTSTSGTLCALDGAHRPLIPAIMYSDSRSRPQAERVQEAGHRQASRLGYGFKPSFALPKILWLKEQRPEIYRQVDLFLSPTDYVIGWLTGEWRRSDHTNVLKWGYDLAGDCWPAFIEEDLGISLETFPAVQAPGARAGVVLPTRAEELGLPTGIPVAAGMTDGCASQISSGAVAPGEYNTTIGTTLVVKGVSRDLLLDPKGRIYCHRHPEGWWLPGGASNTGAECLSREFSPEETDALTASLGDPQPTGLVAYPLVGKGERFPFVAPQAEGFLLGEPADRKELFTANLEGVACLERLAYEVLGDLGARVGDCIFSAGGGARNDAWLQIRADTLGRTVLRPRATGAAMGAAILAAAMDEFNTLTEAVRAIVRMDAEVSPRPELVDRYGQTYDLFREELRRRGYVG
jgi:xylulokinase